MCRPISREPLLILDGLLPRAVEGASSIGPYTGMQLSLLSDPRVFPMRKQRHMGSLTEFCPMLFLPQQNMGKTIHRQHYLLLLFIYSVCLVLCLSWICTSACGCSVTLRKSKVLSVEEPAMRSYVGSCPVPSTRVQRGLKWKILSLQIELCNEVKGCRRALTLTLILKKSSEIRKLFLFYRWGNEGLVYGTPCSQANAWWSWI